jgi:hypothetical protein
MSESDDRVQEALAAHLEHLELGGPEPDVSHLTAEELETLRSLIGLLDQTEGVGFGRGLDERRAEGTASTEAGERLVAVLHDTLPAAARIADDPAATTIGLAGMSVAEGWIVGTFGGRIRVWLVAQQGALEAHDEWLRGLDRVFRLLPDTAAVALVDPGDLSCLLIQPEDCAPAIEVPRGSLLPRRYRRPLHPVGEALSVFLHELIPYWDAAPGFNVEQSPAIDVPAFARDRARRAVEDQAAAGARARKTNPKRAALTNLGDEEAEGLAELALGIHEGRVQPDDIEHALRELATNR